MLRQKYVTGTHCQPFHSDRVGKCDGVDVKQNQMLTLCPFTVIL